MNKNIFTSLLIAILLYVQANAGILRLLPATTTTTTTTTEKSMLAVTDATREISQNTEATFLPKDIDEKLLTTTTVSIETVENAEEEEDTTESGNIALSRDEKATVKLAAKKNPNPNADAEVLNIDTHKSDDAELSKLLLLSVPKTIEKSKEPEENIEEPKELTEEYANLSTTNHDEQSQTTTTVLPIEETTMSDKSVEKDEKINYFETSTESESKSDEDSNEKTQAKAVQEMLQEPHVDNAAHEVLEADIVNDYILVDDTEHLEHEAHFEPYVHSIEIVPSKLEGILLEDFVHEW